MAMRRRDVLKGLSAGFGLGSAVMFSDAWADSGVSPMGRRQIRYHISRALGSTFCNEELEPYMIGRAYLSLHPEEAHIEHLLTKLLGTRVLQRVDQLEARLVQLRQQDFEKGEVAIVQGWILATTEAQACALLTLI
jgi:hypothetical protein